MSSREERNFVETLARPIAGSRRRFKLSRPLLAALAVALIGLPAGDEAFAGFGGFRGSAFSARAPVRPSASRTIGRVRSPGGDGWRKRGDGPIARRPGRDGPPIYRGGDGPTKTISRHPPIDKCGPYARLCHHRPLPIVVDVPTRPIVGPPIVNESGPRGPGRGAGARHAQDRGNTRSSDRGAAFFVPPAGEQRFVQNEVLTDMAGDASRATVNGIARRHRLTLVETVSLRQVRRTFHRWRIDDGRSVAAVIRGLEADRLVGRAQPNFLFTIVQESGRPVGPAQGDPAQYVIGKLHLNEAHRLATGEKILVAVIDTGIDDTHPDLAGTVVDKFEAVRDGKLHEHGTQMAGAIASHGKLLGVAPATRLLSYRAFSPTAKSARGTTANVVKGIDWAMERGAQIINMSFAGPPGRDLELFHDALAKARAKGIVLIAAAGNDGKSEPYYPGADPDVIAVTATDADDKFFVDSNRGRYIAVAAPGVEVLVPIPGGVDFTSGTSVAAAHVSGIVALLLERKHSLKPEDIRKILVSTAHDLDPPGTIHELGAGLIDALEAVRSIEPKAAEKASAVGPAAQ